MSAWENAEPETNQPQKTTYEQKMTDYFFNDTEDKEPSDY